MVGASNFMTAHRQPWMTDQVWRELQEPAYDDKSHAEVLSRWLTPDPKNPRQLVHLIMHRRPSAVERLLELGANADRQPYGSDECGYAFPLDRCVSVSPFPWSIRIAQMILTASIDPFQARPIKPLLSWAIEEPGAVKWLLSNGADPNQQSEEGEVALAYSCTCSEKHVSLLRVRRSVRALLDAGADPDCAGNSLISRPPIVGAAAGERWPLVKLLLLRGADPELGGEHSVKGLSGDPQYPFLSRWIAHSQRRKLANVTPPSKRNAAKARL